MQPRPMLEAMGSQRSSALLRGDEQRQQGVEQPRADPRRGTPRRRCWPARAARHPRGVPFCARWPPKAPAATRGSPVAMACAVGRSRLQQAGAAAAVGEAPASSGDPRGAARRGRRDGPRWDPHRSAACASPHRERVMRDAQPFDTGDGGGVETNSAAKRGALGVVAEGRPGFGAPGESSTIAPGGVNARWSRSPARVVTLQRVGRRSGGGQRGGNARAVGAQFQRPVAAGTAAAKAPESTLRVETALALTSRPPRLCRASSVAAGVAMEVVDPVRPACSPRVCRRCGSSGEPGEGRRGGLDVLARRPGWRAGAAQALSALCRPGRGQASASATLPRQIAPSRRCQPGAHRTTGAAGAPRCARAIRSAAHSPAAWQRDRPGQLVVPGARACRASRGVPRTDCRPPRRADRPRASESSTVPPPTRRGARRIEQVSGGGPMLPASAAVTRPRRAGRGR